MAGNHGSGRHRLPISAHVESGNYRPSRHGPIPDAAEGTPERPRGLTGEARRHWDRVVPDLTERGLAKAIDAHALELLCRLWGWAAAVAKKLDKAPEDRDLALVYRGYVSEYNAIAKRFGLAYGDRQRLKIVSIMATAPPTVYSRKRE